MNHKLTVKNLILFLIITSFLLPSFCFAQVGPPQTVGGLKTTLWNAVKFFPEAIVKVVKGIIDFSKNTWNSYIYPFLHKIWQWINPSIRNEVKQRTPVVKEEAKKESQSMKQDIFDFGKSAWQKIRDFFKFK